MIVKVGMTRSNSVLSLISDPSNDSIPIPQEVTNIQEVFSASSSSREGVYAQVSFAKSAYFLLSLHMFPYFIRFDS
mgnify:CR=1 FL=1